MKTSNIYRQELRNPILIMLAFMLVMIPGFIGLCRHQEIIELSAGWFIPDYCPTEFLPHLLLRESLLSFLMVIITFEVSHRFQQIDSSKRPLFLIKKWLFLPFVSGGIFLLIKTASLYLESTLILDSSYFLDILSDLFKILIITIVADNIPRLASLLRSPASSHTNTLKIIDHPLLDSIEVSDVICVEKKDRNYYALTSDNEYRISLNLSEVENLFRNSHFFRVNRTCIINFSFLKEYNYWEKDKYIVKLTNGLERSVTRKRMQALREHIKSQKQKANLNK